MLRRAILTLRDDLAEPLLYTLSVQQILLTCEHVTSVLSYNREEKLDIVPTSSYHTQVYISTPGIQCGHGYEMCDKPGRMAGAVFTTS